MDHLEEVQQSLEPATRRVLSEIAMWQLPAAKDRDSTSTLLTTCLCSVRSFHSLLSHFPCNQRFRSSNVSLRQHSPFENI
jgi:hypothetical protein